VTAAPSRWSDGQAVGEWLRAVERYAQEAVTAGLDASAS
jgi:hypothetical protein